MPGEKRSEALERYLRLVAAALADLPKSEVAEILSELRSHVLDRVAGPRT